MQNKFLGKSDVSIIFRIKMQLGDDSMNLSHAEYLCKSVQTSRHGISMLKGVLISVLLKLLA